MVVRKVTFRHSAQRWPGPRGTRQGSERAAVTRVFTGAPRAVVVVVMVVMVWWLVAGGREFSVFEKMLSDKGLLRREYMYWGGCVLGLVRRRDQTSWRITR